MDVSRWWRALWTTFGRNHDRQCGKSLTLKASCLRNLFHRGRRWIEKYIAKFWGEWSRNIQHKLPEKWHNSWALNHDNAPAHASLVLQQFLDSTNMTAALPTHRTSPPVMVSYSRRWNWSSRGDVLTALKRSRPNRRTWWRRWRKMTSA